MEHQSNVARKVLWLLIDLSSQYQNRSDFRGKKFSPNLETCKQDQDLFGFNPYSVQVQLQNNILFLWVSNWNINSELPTIGPQSVHNYSNGEWAWETKNVEFCFTEYLSSTFLLLL